MTSQSPRIYTYKITFEEVPYYYYGVHKEKKYNEEYWGSPKTNKWCWELYTPKKQILQLFDFTDEGWICALEVEKRLIQPVFNTDKWCLNENVGGMVSLEVSRKIGTKSKELGLGIHGLASEQTTENSKKGGNKAKELGVGIFGLTLEQRSENGKRGGTKSKELGLGFHALAPEQRSETGRKSGNKIKELSLGIFGLTPEQMAENSKKGGNKVKELGIGIYGRTPEKHSEDSKKAGKIGGKKSSTQKWMCLETGFITNPGNLTKYQKARGIDTSKRIRIS